VCACRARLPDHAPVTIDRSAERPRPPRAPGGTARSSARRLHELALLHDVAQLATQARDWDELMRTIVDRTREAMGVSVCSFYLADREGMRLTLAATNGLDRSQVGRVSLAFGQGLTGLAAKRRRPVQAEDVAADPRFSWVRGLDLAGNHAMLCMPLVWHDQVVGVLNVQSQEVRAFRRDEVRLLRTIGALLAGIIERARLQAEVEGRLATLTALDAARAELLSVVTHELRTPLSVVRVYVDLLADAAAGEAPVPGPATTDGWREAAIEQVSRLDRLVDSILVSARGEGLTGLARDPFDVIGAIGETVETLRLLLRPRPIRWDPPAKPLAALGDAARFRQVLEQLLENEAKYAPPDDGVSIGTWREGNEIRVYVTDDGPGIPIEEWETVFEPFVRIEGRGRGSGIGLFAARRLMDAMGGRVWLEPNGFGGSRFIVALPAA
jgi:signal transduction histidine kinase